RSLKGWSKRRGPSRASENWCARRAIRSKRPNSLGIEQVLSDALEDSIVGVLIAVCRKVDLNPDGKANIATAGAATAGTALGRSLLLFGSGCHALVLGRFWGRSLFCL